MCVDGCTSVRTLLVQMLHVRMRWMQCSQRVVTKTGVRTLPISGPSNTTLTPQTRGGARPGGWKTELQMRSFRVQLCLPLPGLSVFVLFAGHDAPLYPVSLLPRPPHTSHAESTRTARGACAAQRERLPVATTRAAQISGSLSLARGRGQHHAVALRAGARCAPARHHAHPLLVCCDTARFDVLLKASVPIRAI